MRVLDSAGASTATNAPVAMNQVAAGEGAQRTAKETLAVQTVRPPSAEEYGAAVRAAAKQIDSYLKSIGREVEFHVDEDTGTTVVTVRATATGDVIRQIPNEEVLELARRFAAGPGSLLDLTI